MGVVVALDLLACLIAGGVAAMNAIEGLWYRALAYAVLAVLFGVVGARYDSGR